MFSGVDLCGIASVDKFGNTPVKQIAAFFAINARDICLYNLRIPNSY